MPVSYESTSSNSSNNVPVSTNENTSCAVEISDKEVLRNLQLYDSVNHVSFK